MSYFENNLYIAIDDVKDRFGSRKIDQDCHSSFLIKGLLRH